MTVLPDRVRPVSSIAAALAAALLLLATGGCGSPAQTAKTPAATASKSGAAKPAGLITVKVSQPVTAPSQMSLYVGIGKGFFKSEGLNVERVAFHGGGPDVAALLNGDVQFDWTPDSYYVNLLAQGKKALNVFNVQDKSLFAWAMSKKVAQRLHITAATPLQQRLKDLRGLRIGVTKPGSLTDRLAQYYVRRAGLNPRKDVKIVSIGSGSEALAALRHGEVDVMIVPIPIPQVAIQQGFAVQFMGVGTDPKMKAFLMNSIHVLPSYAKQHPGTVRKFVLAVENTIRWEESASPAQIGRVLHRFFPSFKESILNAAAVQVKRALNPSGVETRAAAAATVSLVGKPGVTGGELYGEFDPQFLK